MEQITDMDGSQRIADQKRVIEALRARALPTYAATRILERLITDLDAGAAMKAIEVASESQELG